MTDRDYAIKLMKEITFQMASHAQDYLEVTIERHYTDIKELMTNYQKLILEKAKEMLLNLSLQIRASLAQRRNSGAKNLAEAAKQYIQANYQNPDLSVETICSELHISQSYFSNLFKQETGKSCIQYLTSVRMDRAVELLRTTDDRTYLVAQKVGYDDANYFSYVFKKQFGISPTQFRK